MRLATLAPSIPPLHSSWHTRAAGGMARWPGRIRQHARLYSTTAQDRDSRHKPQHMATEGRKKRETEREREIDRERDRKRGRESRREREKVGEP